MIQYKPPIDTHSQIPFQLNPSSVESKERELIIALTSVFQIRTCLVSLIDRNLIQPEWNFRAGTQELEFHVCVLDF